MVHVDIKSWLRRLNSMCERDLSAAAGVCVSRTHYEVTVEHVLQQFVQDPACDVPRPAKPPEDKMRKVADHSPLGSNVFSAGGGSPMAFNFLNPAGVNGTATRLAHLGFFLAVVWDFVSLATFFSLAWQKLHISSH